MVNQIVYRIDKHYCGKITCDGFGTLSELNEKYNSNSKSVKTLVKDLQSKGTYSFVRIGKKNELCEYDLITIDGEKYTGYSLD